MKSLTITVRAPRTGVLTRAKMLCAEHALSFMGIVRVEYVGRTGKKHAWDSRNRVCMKQPFSMTKNEEVRVTIFYRQDFHISIGDEQVFFETQLCPCL